MTAPSASSLLERATQQLDLKNTAEAERICREALRLDPWLADAHLQLATVLQAADRKTEAIAALTTMTKALPQDVRGYRRLGAAHQDMQGYGAATAAYLQAVKLPGADHDDLKRLAACQSLAGLTVDAAQTLTALTRLEPDAAEHPYNLSQLMTKLGNADAARTAIRKACQLLPNNAQLLSEAGQLHEAAGLLDEAEAFYNQLTRAVPHDAWAHVRLARALLAQHKLSAAEPVLIAACGCANATPKIFLYAAGELKNRRQFSTVVTLLETAHERWPEDAEILLSLAHTYAFCFNATAAEVHYKKLLGRHPDSASYWEGYAQACVLVGQSEQALNACTKALSLAPPGEHLSLYLMRARLLEAAGHHTDATAVRHHALEMFKDPESQDSIITDIQNTEGLGMAETLWLNRIMQEGERAGLLLKLTYNYIQQARWDDVDKTFHRAQTCAPNSTDLAIIQLLRGFLDVDCPFLRHEPPDGTQTHSSPPTDDVIIIRGAVARVHLPIIAHYRAMNPDKYILLTTWRDTPASLLNSARPYIDDIVLNDRPDTPGSTNINFQLACAAGGLRRARELGAQRALITRTDLGFLNPTVLADFKRALDLSQTNTLATPRLNKRLIICDIWTVRFPFYHASDLFSYGLLEDLEKYWHENQSTSSCLNTEVNLCRGFARNVGRALTNDAVDSLRATQDLFIVRDARPLGFYWIKHPGIIRDAYNQRPEIITEAVWRGGA